jgi:peptidyl-prolyl cis-trans isomerase C
MRLAGATKTRRLGRRVIQAPGQVSLAHGSARLISLARGSARLISLAHGSARFDDACRGLAIVLVLACGCGKPKEADAPAKKAEKHGLTEEQAKLPLVVVGDSTVTLGQFAEQIAEKSPYLRARYASPARRRELLEELVKFELMAKEASRRGLDKTEEVERAKRQVMVQQMMKTEFEDKVKLSDISDSEIEAYYKAHPEEFNKPAQVRASHIVLRDETKAKRVLKLALEAKEDEVFRKLVSEYSEDEVSKAEGGDLHFFSKPEERTPKDPALPEAVVQAAFKLENLGDVYPELVKSPAGYHIVRLTSKRKALARTLDHARRPIQNKLWREKREAAVSAFIQDLRAKAHIEEHLALLDQVQVDLPDAGAGEKSHPSSRPGAQPGSTGAHK